MTNFLFLEEQEEVLLLFAGLTQVIIVSVWLFFHENLKFFSLAFLYRNMIIPCYITTYISYDLVFLRLFQIALKYFWKIAGKFIHTLQDLIFFSVIVDADSTGNTCHTALFNIGGTTTTSRSWNVLITQYSCGDTDSSGYVFNMHYNIIIFCQVLMYRKSLLMQPNICLITLKSINFWGRKFFSN